MGILVLTAAELRVALLQQALRDFARHVGFAGLAVLGSGVIVALACAVAAIAEGVSIPVALMAGYCTCASSACLCVLLRPSRQNIAEVPVLAIPIRLPNYDAWRLVATLRVADAARLWSGIEPGCPASQEAIAWAQAMLDAIKRGELSIHQRQDVMGRTLEQEKINPGWHTEITREGLKSWALSHGHNPPFLVN